MVGEILNYQLFNHLYRYCYSLIGDDDKASDLLQGAFEKYLLSGHSAIAVNKRYLMTIIRHRWIDDWRKNSRLVSELFDDEKHIDFDIATLEQTMVDRDILATLWAGFDEVEREILFLWAVEGYTTSEVARWMDLPRGTVLSRISRLRKRVQGHNRKTA